ncbi:MAG: fluoride efflux transporter CrcB [Deltaproteobacteria bacterium]|nr:fluoride efflux transporter CrcB [Deltaproteobacteria bacterium]
MTLFWIAVGGAMGAVTRYKVFDVAQRYVSGFFPWGTLVVNVFGSFLMGLLWPFFDRFPLPTQLKLTVFVGFIGAFTTFSNYSLETLELIRIGQVGDAVLNILLNNILCLVVVYLGFYASRQMMGVQ